MIQQCLVCEGEHDFNGDWDSDCNRCENCGSLPYSEVDSIVLGHRKEWAEYVEGNWKKENICDECLEEKDE